MQAQKIGYILLLLTCVAFSAKAQKFVSLDNRWRMDRQDWSATYKYITFFKDSVEIDGKYYYQSYDSVVNVLTPRRDYFRQEGGIVYYYWDNGSPNGPKEQVIYNFNMAVGDSIVYHNNYRLKVVKIDSISLLDGSKRKRLELTTNYFRYNLYWVEGIGGIDIETLRPHYATISDGTSTFSCYFYKNEARYSNQYYAEGCALNLANPVSTHNLQELTSIEVLQNQGDGTIVFQLNEPGKYQYHLYSATGALLEQKTLGQGVHHVSLGAFPQGMYFMRVIDTEKLQQKTLKIVKQ